MRFFSACSAANTAASLSRNALSRSSQACFSIASAFSLAAFSAASRAAVAAASAIWRSRSSCMRFASANSSARLRSNSAFINKPISCACSISWANFAASSFATRSASILACSASQSVSGWRTLSRNASRVSRKCLRFASTVFGSSLSLSVTSLPKSSK